MNIKVKVDKLLGNKIIVANLENKFSEVQQLFTEFNVHHLPVVEDNKLIGIISTTDLMRWYSKNSKNFERIDQDSIDSSITIEELMTRNPITLSPDDNLVEAIKIFSNRKFQALPIVENDEVLGMITTRDIVKYIERELKIDADNIF